MEEYKKVTISFAKDQLEKLDDIMSKEPGYTRKSLVDAVDNYKRKTSADQLFLPSDTL